MIVVHPNPHPLATQIVNPSSESVYGKFGIVRVEDWEDRVSGTPYSDNVNVFVRCHSILTGEMILLHDDWLPKPSDVA